MSNQPIKENREIVEDEIMLALRNLREMLVRVEDMDSRELAHTGKILQVLNSMLVLQSMAECEEGDMEEKQKLAKQVLGVYNTGTRELVESYLDEFALSRVVVGTPSGQMFSYQC